MTDETPEELERLHIMPITDDFQHVKRDCECGPVLDGVTNMSGAVRWFVWHRPMNQEEEQCGTISPI